MSDGVRLNSNLTARRCACKGWIQAPELSTATANKVSTAVNRHQSTRQHREWDAEAWIEANTTTDAVPSATLRKIA